MKWILAIRLRSRIIAPIIVILLILQAGATQAFPFGGHLSLCIGSDGHIGIDVDDCTTDFTQPLNDHDVGSEDSDHHGDCVDIAIGCASLEKEVIPTESIRRLKASFKDGSISSIIEFAVAHIGNSNKISFRDFADCDDGTFPLSCPFCKTTTVLII